MSRYAIINKPADCPPNTSIFLLAIFDSSTNEVFPLSLTYCSNFQAISYSKFLFTAKQDFNSAIAPPVGLQSLFFGNLDVSEYFVVVFS